MVERQRNGKNSKWSKEEMQILMHAYKNNYKQRARTKSARGKKGVWDKIHTEFCDEYFMTDLSPEQQKSQAQVKEKWKTVFDKYKEIKDNNKATGQGRIDNSFEYFEDIDSFMGCSDKVEPKFVRQTVIVGDDQDVMICDEDNKARSSGSNRGMGPDNQEHPAPRKKSKNTRVDESLLAMLDAQQSAIEKVEENDRKMFQSMMQFQEEAEKRHQEFTMSVLRKLGDIFG